MGHQTRTHELPGGGYGARRVQEKADITASDTGTAGGKERRRGWRLAGSN
jgi:hypothetical protein